jgi:hypothetical protein
MKKLFYVGVFLLAILALWLTFAPDNLKTKVNMGGFYEFNKMSYLKNIATSTQSYCATCPVKLLDKNTANQYVRITNTGDTGLPIYIYATNTDIDLNLNGALADNSALRATSTISFPLKGIMLTASSSIEFDNSSFVTGNLWASSTGAALIYVNYY